MPEAAGLVRARTGTGPQPVWLLLPAHRLPSIPGLCLSCPPRLWGLLSCEVEVIQPRDSGMGSVTSQTPLPCPSSARVPSRSLTLGPGVTGGLPGRWGWGAQGWCGCITGRGEGAWGGGWGRTRGEAQSPFACVSISSGNKKPFNFIVCSFGFSSVRRSVPEALGHRMRV